MPKQSLSNLKYWICFHLLIFTSIIRAEVLTIDESLQSLAVSNYLEFSNNPDFSDKVDWTPETTFPKNTYRFFKLTLQNTSNKTLKLCLGTNLFDKWHFIGQNPEVKTGNAIAFDDKQFDHNPNSYAYFSINPGETKTLKGVIETLKETPIHYAPLPPTLYEADFLTQKTAGDNDFFLFFIGALVIMTFYNLALYLIIKKSHYLNYVAYNIMMLLFVTVQTGHLEALFIGNAFYHEEFIMVIGNLFLVVYILFAARILNFNKTAPKIQKLILPFNIVWVLLCIPIFLGFAYLSFTLGSIGALIAYNVVLIQTIKAVRNKNAAARYFLAGNIFHYFSITCSVLMINGVLPSELNGFSAIEIVELGTLFELALFSLTLASTIKELEAKLSEAHFQRKLALDKAAFKDQFLANMSHEIRTPLNGVIGMLDVFKSNGKFSDEQNDQLQIVQNSADSLLNVINDILDLSKIQAGKMTIRPFDLRLRDQVQITKGIFLPMALEKQLSLDVEIDPKIPEFICTDGNRLSQILNNLTSNALKFTYKGGAVIRASLLERVDQELKLLFEVEDSGPGISKEDQGKIFENFSQIEETNIRRSDGTGLGLTISKQLSILLGGNISLKSTPGEGSVFSFTIVCQEGKAIETQADSQEQEKPSFEVLLVEDKPVNQKVAQLMLKKLGHHTTIAENGQVCLDLFEEGKFDFILMDIQMPIMDGLTATKELKTRYSNVPPIIGLSANAVEGDMEKYLKLGFDAYIAKPVRLDTLEKHLRK